MEIETGYKDYTCMLTFMKHWNSNKNVIRNSQKQFQS